MNNINFFHQYTPKVDVLDNSSSGNLTPTYRRNWSCNSLNSSVKAEMFTPTEKIHIVNEASLDSKNELDDDFENESDI